MVTAITLIAQFFYHHCVSQVDSNIQSLMQHRDIQFNKNWTHSEQNHCSCGI